MTFVQGLLNIGHNSTLYKGENILFFDFTNTVFEKNLLNSSLIQHDHQSNLLVFPAIEQPLQYL